MNTYDLGIAATIRQLEDRAAVGVQMSRFISSGFCPQCGTMDGMQPLDYRGVEQSKDEDIFTDSTGNMYTPCIHCNTGQIVPDGYRQATGYEAMQWALADKKAELDEIGDNAAERESWRRRYEKGMK